MHLIDPVHRHTSLVPLDNMRNVICFEAYLTQAYIWLWLILKADEFMLHSDLFWVVLLSNTAI